MAIENVPLYFGNNLRDPVGRVSIFDKTVEDQFVKILEPLRTGQPQDNVRFLFAFEGQFKPNKIEVISFAIVPDPVPAIPKLR